MGIRRTPKYGGQPCGSAAWVSKTVVLAVLPLLVKDRCNLWQRQLFGRRAHDIVQSSQLVAKVGNVSLSTRSVLWGQIKAGAKLYAAISSIVYIIC